MKGDFTRNTFNPAKHFSRVMMQQGRVTLDADYNEQTAILLHYLQTLAADLIGPYAGASGNTGFTLRYDPNLPDLVIGVGRYYVDGILIENAADTRYSQQLDYPLTGDDPLAAELQKRSGVVFWVYLDVWERHITYIEDDEIREKALNGPDTCTRAKVVWQVKALPASQLPDRTITPAEANPVTCAAPLGSLVAVSQASLIARLDPGQTSKDPCVTPPDSSYRGLENQLYRVEIHDPGSADTATFKWSRDNGSVVTSWLNTEGNDLHVLHGCGFEAGNWVELSDHVHELQGVPGILINLTKVQGDTLTVDPASLPKSSGLPDVTKLLNPTVRRWDQSANQANLASKTFVNGAVCVQETSATTDVWIDLEDGLQIQFLAKGQYRTGDYWLIPARVATGKIEWPPLTDDSGKTLVDASGKPLAALPPDGIEHHYAPLGFFALDGHSVNLGSCRCTIEPASSCFRSGSLAIGAHLVRPINFEARSLSEEAVEEKLAHTITSREQQ
jgi:hypothetical protein